MAVIPGVTAQSRTTSESDIALPQVQSIFETHIHVSNCQSALTFYRDKLGFQVAHTSVERDFVFMWMAEPGTMMLGLWGPQCPNPPISPQSRSHFAMRVSFDQLQDVFEKFARVGIVALDFDGNPATELVVLSWMPAASIYFQDPDGHSLEYISMLDAKPHPEFGVIGYAEWCQRIG